MKIVGVRCVRINQSSSTVVPAGYSVRNGGKNKMTRTNHLHVRDRTSPVFTLRRTQHTSKWKRNRGAVAERSAGRTLHALLDCGVGPRREPRKYPRKTRNGANGITSPLKLLKRDNDIDVIREDSSQALVAIMLITSRYIYSSRSLLLLVLVLLRRC